MRIQIITPAPPGSLSGNRRTAERWMERLTELGHEVRIDTRWRGERTDVLLALHATKSADSVSAWRVAHPARPLVVAVGGTDLSVDLGEDPRTLASLEAADRIVVLQQRALDGLPPKLRPRARVIVQSAEAPHLATDDGPSTGAFDVCVVAHLRAIKDPFLPARAARRLRPDSRVHITHFGGVLDDELEAVAREEMRANPRYTWKGGRPHAETYAALVRSRLLVLSSRAEGGANALVEALAAGIPLLATRIPGNTGLIGDDHPGLFAADDEAGLAALLERAELDEPYFERLRAASAALRESVSPARERAAWKSLLEDLVN